MRKKVKEKLHVKPETKSMAAIGNERESVP